jgi:hypothetical protein
VRPVASGRSHLQLRSAALITAAAVADCYDTFPAIAQCVCLAEQAEDTLESHAHVAPIHHLSRWM